VKALFALIARVDPSFAARARGVAPVALADLEDAWGQPLPGAYRALFTEVVGDLPMFANADLEFAPSQLVGHILDEHSVVQGDRPAPERFLPLAVVEDDALFLDLAHPCGDDDARVVRVVDACYDDAQTLAASLRDWLMGAAFRRLVASRFALATFMIWQADTLDGCDGQAAAAVVARALGLEELAGTSPVLALHLGPDLAVTTHTDDDGLTVTLRATDRLRLTRALRAFTAGLPPRA